MQITQRYRMLNNEMEKEIDHKTAIYYQRLFPNALISNKEFCEITGVNSVGSFQYDNNRKYFTYREQFSIHNLKKLKLLTFIIALELKAKKFLGVDNISVFLRENKYSLRYEIRNQKYLFSKVHDTIFPLLLDFYFYCKNKSINKIA